MLKNSTTKKFRDLHNPQRETAFEPCDDYELCHDGCFLVAPSPEASAKQGRIRDPKLGIVQVCLLLFFQYSYSYYYNYWKAIAHDFDLLMRIFALRIPSTLARAGCYMCYCIAQASKGGL